jgi:dTDP-4-amino-4,6-dideoxygalactose transaminase
MQELLSGLDELILPASISLEHACHLYVVRLNTDKVPFGREALRAILKDRFGVYTVVQYPAAWSWEVIQSIEHDKSHCPVAEKACEQVFSLPIFPHTPFEDLIYIKDALSISLHGLRQKSG